MQMLLSGQLRDNQLDSPGTVKVPATFATQSMCEQSVRNHWASEDYNTELQLILMH